MVLRIVSIVLNRFRKSSTNDSIDLNILIMYHSSQTQKTVAVRAATDSEMLRISLVFIFVVYHNLKKGPISVDKTVYFWYSQYVMAQSKDLSLAFGYWLVSHRQTLRTWWAVTLMVIIASTLLWSLWFFTVFFSQDTVTSGHLLDRANSIASFRVANLQPSPLTVSSATVIPRNASHVDLVAMVTNSNSAWGASSVTAHFTVDGTTFATQQIFLNPSAVRPIIGLNIATAITSTSKVAVVIDETTWARSTASALPEPRFTVTNTVANPSTVVIDGQSRQSVTLTAEVTNTSVYNFYHVDVPVVAYNGDQIVGVASIGVDRWPTLTIKTVTATLTNPITTVTKFNVIPQVSRFDSGNTYR